MTPKKDIIIALVLFLIMVAAFFFLYLKKQLAGPSGESGLNLPVSSTSVNQEKLSPVQQQIKAIEAKTIEQVAQIIEQGKTSSGGIRPDAQRKIEEAVNQEIMEKMKLRTPEQLEADKQKQDELDEMERQINQQIKDQLQYQ